MSSPASSPIRGGHSRLVDSSQTSPAPQLRRLVHRHLTHPWRRPLAQHTIQSWALIRSVLKEAPYRPIVLDSGCGTGASAWRLADRHPAAWIVAIDQSAQRLGLSKGIRRHQNIVWARAELGDVWRLMAGEHVNLAVHYLLYPNPWPKPGHLMRRWHAHPAFRDLLRLGGRLESRSNWPIYLQELALAIHWATGTTAQPRPLNPNQALTPFEKKYSKSGHKLFQLSVCLNSIQTEPSRLDSSSACPGG